jgi:hypothetical protein
VISQYKPDEKRLGRFSNDDSDGMSPHTDHCTRNNTKEFPEDEVEDEDEDEDSDMNSDGTAEPLEDRLIDLTTKPTPIASKIDVIKYITKKSWWVSGSDVNSTGDPLEKVRTMH